MALTVGGAIALAGCGLADSRSPVPEFMRNKAAEPPPPEAPPDVKRLVREKLDTLFTAASNPRNVRVSEAPSHGLPVLIYDHRCPGAQAYIQLAAEMLRRGKAA